MAVSFSEIGFERVVWLVDGRVAVGTVTLLAGIPGVGKSLWTIALAAQVSNAGKSVLLLSAEDSLSSTVKPRLIAAGADVDRVKTVHLRRHGIDEGLAIPDDVPELARLVEEHDVRLVVIDPLMAHLQNQVNSWRDQSVRRALAPLHQMAEMHGCAVVVVVHLNKAASNDPLLRIGGSIGMAAAARSVLLFGRDPDDPESERGPQRVLAHVKCNLAPIAPSLLYEVEPTLVLAPDGGADIETAKLELVGECHHNAADLLTQADPEQHSATAEAVNFLLDQLADGDWHLSTAIKDAAKDDGHSQKTLRRARERLRVETKRDGYPAKTTWRLPVEVQPSASRAHAGDGICGNGSHGHDCANPHEQTDATRSAVPSTRSRAHHKSMGTTEAIGEADAGKQLADQGPYPGGEAAVLADLIKTFDAEERTL